MSDLVGNPKDRFSCVGVHIKSTKKWVSIHSNEYWQEYIETVKKNVFAFVSDSTSDVPMLQKSTTS